MEAVSVDPVAVVLYFEPLEFSEGGGGDALPLEKGVLQADVGSAEEGMGLEIPRGFKVVPVGFSLFFKSLGQVDLLRCHIGRLV